MRQFFAVYHKDTGKLVSVGDFVQGADNCICSHSAIEEPGHPIGNDETGRPLGCQVEGCWHNYEVVTPVVTIGDDDSFVSAPLAVDLVALPLAARPDETVVWNTKALAFVPSLVEPLVEGLDPTISAFLAAIPTAQRPAARALLG